MGIPAPSFEQTYPEKTDEMRRLFFEYIKSLRAGVSNSIGIPPRNTVQLVTIELDADCFPLVPVPWDGQKYSKRKLEDLFRGYVGQHYCMLHLLIPMPMPSSTVTFHQIWRQGAVLLMFHSRNFGRIWRILLTVNICQEASGWINRAL